MAYFDPITLSAVSKPSSSPLPFKKYSPQQLLNNNNNRLPNSSISPLQSIMGITTMSSLSIKHLIKLFMNIALKMMIQSLKIRRIRQ